MDRALTPLERAWAGWTEALDGHPFVTVSDLFAELAQGFSKGQGARWWPGEHSDVFTRIDRGVLEIGPVAGDADEMLNIILPQIEDWARAEGCAEVHVQAGRSGWSRVLKPLGYAEAAVILRKKL